jgi:hypothetical protein
MQRKAFEITALTVNILVKFEFWLGLEKWRQALGFSIDRSPPNSAAGPRARQARVH